MVSHGYMICPLPMAVQLGHICGAVTYSMLLNWHLAFSATSSGPLTNGFNFQQELSISKGKESI